MSKYKLLLRGKLFFCFL